MNDQELLELVLSTPTAKLTTAQVELLGQRIVRSDELRDGLAERLAEDRALAAALGPLDSEQPSEPAATRLRGCSIFFTLFFGLCLLAVGLAAGLLAENRLGLWRQLAARIEPLLRQIEPEQPAAADEDKPAQDQHGSTESEVPDKPENTEPTEDHPGDTPPKPDDAHSDDGVPKPADVDHPFHDGQADAQPTKPPDDGDKPEPAPPVPARPKKLVLPPGPWTAEDQLGGPVLPFEEIAGAGFGPNSPGMAEETAKQWFAPVHGHAAEMQHRGGAAAASVVLKGLFRLRAPWPDDAVLRLEITSQNGLKMHFWNGKTGATFASVGGSQNTGWAGYRTSRRGKEPLPDAETLTGTDGGRYRRTYPGKYVTLDVRFQNGSMLLYRGEVRLLTVPVDGPPKEAYVEGSGVHLQRLRMFRSTPVPQPPRADRPVVMDVDQPATLDWRTETSGQRQKVPAHRRKATDAGKNLPDGYELQTLPDGGVRLAAEADAPLVWSGVELAPPGVCEIIAHLEDVSPETGVYLGDADGEPVYAPRFFEANKSGPMVMVEMDPHQTRQPRSLSFRDAAAPLVDERPWVRFVCAGNYLKVWTGADGVHWGEVLLRETVPDKPVGSIGLYCAPVKARRSITLRRIVVREFSAINAFSPVELRRRAAAVAGGDLGTWLEGAAAQPDDVDTDRWRTACLLRTFGRGLRVGCGRRLTELLLGRGMATDRPIEDRLKLLGELAEAGNTWQPSSQSVLPEEMAAYYERLGMEVLRNGDPRPFWRVGRRLVTDPIWSSDASRSVDRRLIQWEVVALAAAGRWEELRRVCRHLALFEAAPSGSLSPLAAWGGALAARRIGRGPGNEPITLDPEWRHPLVVQTNKEGYNMLAELRSALDAKSYKDAARIITTAQASEGLGLLPDRRDRGRWLSLSATVSEAVEKHPELLAAMRKEFGPLGSLRVGRAVADGDAAAVAAVLVQFPGTEAADLARRWLGDRALSAGQFARAVAYYDRIGDTGDAAPGEVAARRRLAAAMMGKSLGEPLTESVHFGETEMSAAEFEKLVAEMIRTHATAGEAKPPTPHDDAAKPPPTRFEVQHRARFDAATGKSPERIPQPIQNDRIDWAARQMAFTIEGNALYLSNRFGVAAFELPSGRRHWQANIADGEAQAHAWSLVPMRPLVAGDHLYVRRLTKEGPSLVCLATDRGQKLWETEPHAGHFVLSDPLLPEGEPLALTAVDGGGRLTVSLTAYDGDSGEVVRSRPIVQLERSFMQLPFCGAVASGDSVVAAFGGSVVCCDPDGRVRWLRRQLWWSAAQSPGVVRQHAARPLLRGGKLFIAQPGVPAVECIDPDDGSLSWRYPCPNIERLSGIVGDKLIVETAEGLTALSTATGRPLWRHEAGDRLDAMLCPWQGRILYARREAAADGKKLQPEIVFVDPETGVQTARRPLAELADADPMLGPMFAGEDRLWVLFGRGIREPKRELIELVPKEEPAAATADAESPPAALDPWTEHVPAQLREAARRILPKWTLFSGDVAPEGVTAADYRGRKDVLIVAVPPGRSARLARRVALPKDKDIKLRLMAACHAQRTCKIDVRVEGKTLWEQTLNDTVAKGGWFDAEVDLTPYAGRTLWIVVRQHGVSGTRPPVYWKRLEIAY